MSNKRIVRALGTSPRNAGGRNGAGVGADGMGVGNRMGMRMGMGKGTGRIACASDSNTG